VLLPADRLASGALFLPQEGDVVEATGTFDRLPWNDAWPSAGTTRPVLRDLTELKRVDGPPPPKAAGVPCTADMECADRLVCERRSSTCTAVSEGRAVRAEDGLCSSDDDCPAGEACTSTASVDGGTPPASARACAIAPGWTRERLCPRAGTPSDVAGGRYAAGKEVCVVATPSSLTHPAEGQTELRFTVAEPLTTPTGTDSIIDLGVIGGTTARYLELAGSQTAGPKVGREALMLGTVQFDAPHGRFVLRPIKAWWPTH